MGNVMKFRIIPVLLQVAVFAPVWQWYARRITDGSDEPWGLAALGTALLMFLVKAKPDDEKQPHLAIPAIMILLYAASYPVAPRLVQALIAVIALGMTLSTVRFGTWLHIPTQGLLSLSLPVIPSLQFYLGYPLRVLSAATSAPLLQLSGVPVVREGTCLRWGHELVSIDAPCSGVQMLWVGLYCVFTMAGLLELGTRHTLALAVLAFPVILAGNAVRSASLFYLETGIIHLPSWCHNAAGLCTFALAACCLVMIALTFRSRGERPCAG